MKHINKKHYVCLLGSGPWQRELFEILLNMEILICSIAPENNFEEAHLFIRADVRDVAAICSQVDAADIVPIIFISSQTDLTVNSVAKLNAHFNISDKGLNAAQIFTNKFSMRQAVEKLNGNILNPKYSIIYPQSIDSQIHSLDEDLLSNVVIKPTSLQSSLGVKHIENVFTFNFLEYFRSLAQYKIDEFIIEEVIHGVEHTIEGYKHLDGEHEILTASSKSKEFGFGIANALHYSTEALERCNLIQKELNNLFSCYDFGPTHTEIIYSDDGKFYLVEAAVRGGGSGIPSHVVPAITGFYPEKQMLVDSRLIATCERKSIEYKIVSLIFYEFRHSVATHINTRNVQSNIIRSWTDYKPGEPVRTIFDDRSRHGFVIVGSGTRSEHEGVLAILARDNPGMRLHV